MKIVMLEPLGISEDAVISLAKPFIDQGHEFVFCGKKIQTLYRKKSHHGRRAFAVLFQM
jgi:hypothetical protein